jgi:hypothetical protein
MRRSTLLLIAAITVTSFCTVQAAGQFPIPKIKLPTIPKKDPTPTPGRTDPVSPTDDRSTSTASTPASDGKMRGKPIAGAKITFSNNPDGSNPKNTFSSSEYIYGRLDLGGRTVYDVFGFKNLGDRKFYSLHYHTSVFQPGKDAWEHEWGGARTSYTLVTKEEAQKTYWNFDVLPDPSKVSSLQSAIEDDLNYYHTMINMYHRFSDVDSARREFPQNGPYIVDITIFGDAYDDWGKAVIKTEEYPTASARFTFNFSGSDGQTLIANSKKAGETIENARNQREMLRAMPSWWAGARTPAEPRLAPARLVPLIKGFIAQWNLTYLKHAVYPHTGPLWVIQKNSVGIPEYRMVSPYIYIIYKDPKDNSCQYGALYMREPYSGAGTYGEPYLGGIREVQYIDCAVVK